MLDRAGKRAARLLLASTTLAVAGCTALPEQAREPPPPAPPPAPRRAPSKPAEPLPAWVTHLPPPRAGKVFFRNWVEGYYRSPQDAFDEAEKRALADVVNTIAVHVSSEIVIIEDEKRQEVSSEVRTWASEFVRKDPNREEFHWKEKRRYHVLISVPEAICEPTAENLVRFIRKQYHTYVSEKKDRKALESLKTLVRLDPSGENKLLIFDYLRGTERWTAAKRLADILVLELDPGSKELAKLKRLLPLLTERSGKEPQLREAKRKKRLARMRVGVAAFVDRESEPDLERRVVGALRGSGVTADGASDRLVSLTVRRMTRNIDLVRGLVGRTSTDEDVTHVVAGQVEVLWLMKKKVKGGSVDYYVSFISGAFIDLKRGEVLESFVREAVERAGVRSGEDTESRTQRCKKALGANAAASLAGRLPRLVKEYVERR